MKKHVGNWTGQPPRTSKDTRTEERAGAQGASWIAPQKTSSAVRSTTAQKVDDILGQRLASLRLANLDTEAIEETEHFLFDETNKKAKRW
ncbi:hypothetical protein FQN60_005563 [Etheostoma spectabile]|uniref:Uncharacterized protein n=1 Tax=Etheostoma spectabile TaxID=54343 RepID=A0A5J5CEN8_9PERO|nr:hypothetical protein FQN60_005563 [Etheostoma spectabile]